MKRPLKRELKVPEIVAREPDAFSGATLCISIHKSTKRYGDGAAQRPQVRVGLSRGNHLKGRYGIVSLPVITLQNRREKDRGKYLRIDPGKMDVSDPSRNTDQGV